jgi:adenylate cyclase
MPPAKAVEVAGDVDAIRDWIVQQGLASDDLPALLSGFCERIVAVGVPLWRGHTSLATLHPMYEAIGYSWRRTQGLTHDRYEHGSMSREVWQRSPMRFLVENRVWRMRHRLELGEGTEAFPVLAELRDEGATDWLGGMISFGDATQRAGLPGMVTSWTSDRAGGFSDADIALIENLLATFALAVYRIALFQVAVDLLDAYVGAEPGRRILSGQVRQGTAQQLAAAIAIADLRGFTAVADRTPAARLVAGLNEHLGAVVEAVEQHGGQVLKFLGDGLMAVFPLEARPAEACADALAAAQAALAANAAINGRREAAGEAALALDVALHLGEVMYGNVGSTRRLDFTVIGPAVNEASRIEALCEPLGCHVLTSAAFARACPHPLRSRGQHPLRGVASPQELFTLA